MRILILGATGFIGNAIFHTLIGKHKIVIGGRNRIEGYSAFIKIDFNKENHYEKCLENIDLVINAIGIIEGNFNKVQTEEPIKLFKSCEEKGIKIINISAIGAEQQVPKTDFLQSKKASDEFILTQTMGKVIYPGIVLGDRAKSSKFFKELSGLPLIPLLSNKPIPFIHISQLVELVNNVIENYENCPPQIFAVSEPETLREIFTALKKSRPIFFKVPGFIVQTIFRVFPGFSLGVFNKNMFSLLNSTNAMDYQPTFKKASLLLKSNRIQGSHYLLKFIVLVSLFFIWIWSGIISLTSWDKSLELIQNIGIRAIYGTYFIIAGSVADILLGFGLLNKKQRTNILLIQIAFILIYTMTLSILAPSYWLYPFGPVAKNIPLLALTYLIYKWEKNDQPQAA